MIAEPSRLTALRAVGLTAVVGLFAGLLCGAAGCVAVQQGPADWNVLRTMDARLPTDGNDINYILSRMEFGRTALGLGAYDRARCRLKEAYDKFEEQKDNVAAAISSEGYKFYKGESYEQAMLCLYLGYVEYVCGNYPDARRYFARAADLDKGAVVKETTPPCYGEDFALAFFWWSRACEKLGSSDDARRAMTRAVAPVQRNSDDQAKEQSGDAAYATRMEKRRLAGEKWAWETFCQAEEPAMACPEMADLSACRECPARPVNTAIKRASSRDEFFSVPFQQQTNLVVMIEVGSPPFKYLTGIHQERTEIGRGNRLLGDVRVYLDDLDAGSAYQALDLWDQAATQDRIDDKDAAQTGKAILKEIGSHLPYIGDLFAYWNVTGDTRQWHGLPGRAFLFAAGVPPGLHSIRVEMCDPNGCWLPRWSTTVHGVCVKDSGETCLIIKPYYDNDNRLSPEKRTAAAKAGACGFNEEVILPAGYRSGW